MTEKAENVLKRLDLLLEAAKVNDNNYLIQALEYYDSYMKTRVPDRHGVFAEKFSLPQEKAEDNDKLKKCTVVVSRLSEDLLEKYLPSNIKK